MKYKFENIPQELKDVDQWLLWKLEPNEKKPGDYKKVPYNINGFQADVTNRFNHSSFDKVVDTFSGSGDSYAGIGFAFISGDGFVGIDLDNVVDKSTGEVKQEAKAIVDELDSYTEYSPSRTGFHIICKGEAPTGKKRKGFIEMYDDARYFTFTGDVVKESKVNERQEAINGIHAKYLFEETRETTVEASKPSILTDDEIINLGKTARNGKDFEDLLFGEFSKYDSQSEADLAFANMLAFLTAKDKNQMDRIFRKSGLYREKWDKKHSSNGMTYGEMTINQSVLGCKEVYSPKVGKVERKKSLSIVTFADIEPTETEWLWYPYLPKGKIVLMVADPGTGKTMLALNFCSVFSNGGDFWKEDSMFFGEQIEPMRVLYQTAEDGIQDTLVPRILKMSPKPNMHNIGFIDDRESPLSFSSEEIEKAVAEFRPSLMVFDPLQAYLGADVDMHRANEVRPVLAHLGNISEKYGCTMLLIMHMSKMSQNSAMYRALGSIDIPAISRSMLHLVKNIEEPGQIALCHTKSSLAITGKSILFHIDMNEGGIVFDGFSDKTADEFLQTRVKTERGKPALDDAMEFLEDILKDGVLRKSEIVKKGYELGISEMSLKRAKEILGVKHRLVGFPSKSYWGYNVEDLSTEELLALEQ